MRLLLLTTGLWPKQGLEIFNGPWAIKDGSSLVYTVHEVYYRGGK